jgi:hypothetical protein
MDQLYHGCCCHCHLDRPAVKLSRQPESRRLWLRPYQFSSWKGPDCHFRTGWFLSWVDSPSPHYHLCPRVSGGERCQDDIPPTLFTGYHPSELFPLSKNEVRAGWLFEVPGQLQDELGRAMQTIPEDEFANTLWRLYEIIFPLPPYQRWARFWKKSADWSDTNTLLR